MKIKSIIVATSILFLSSCGMNAGYIANVNNTQVILDEANYTYVGSATGEATSVWVFGIGPLGAQALVQKAKDDLASKVNLYDGARALANMTVDEKVRMITPLFIQRTAYISADVVEFK